VGRMRRQVRNIASKALGRYDRHRLCPLFVVLVVVVERRTRVLGLLDPALTPEAKYQLPRTHGRAQTDHLSGDKSVNWTNKAD
jgi:hypothetical protein